MVLMEKKNKKIKFWMSVFYALLLAALIIFLDPLFSLVVAAVVSGILFVVYEMITAPLKPADYGMDTFEQKLYDIENRKNLK